MCLSMATFMWMNHNVMYLGTKRAESFWRELLYKSVMALRSTLSVIEWVYLYFPISSFLKTQHFIWESCFIFVACTMYSVQCTVYVHCTLNIFPHDKKPNADSQVIHSDKFTSCIRKCAINLVLFSESRMEEESKGEPSKVESANIDQNQSPKKVARQKVICQKLSFNVCHCRDQHCQPPHPALRLLILMTHRCIFDNARLSTEQICLLAEPACFNNVLKDCWLDWWERCCSANK